MVEFGRHLSSAGAYALETNGRGSLKATVESYDRHTGQTIRNLGLPR